MSETKIETVVVDSGDRDHEAPLIILGVFQQVISSDIGTARLREAGSLSPEGAEILEKIMWGGRSPLAATGSLNMIKTLGKVCGFAESRAKAALAKAVSMGLMNGGPLPS